MLKLISRTLAVLALVLVVAVPGTASARINLNRSAPEGPSVAIRTVSQPSTSGGFDFGDAAIGAGVVLLVVGVGTGAGISGRRRRISRAATA